MATGSEIDDKFMCPVHLDILDDPVVLECQHWICKGCLQRYVNSRNGIDLECPECRTPFDLPPGGVDAFPVNHRMRDICQTFLVRQNSRSPEVTCGKHRDEPLSRFCCICLEAVCEECSETDHTGHRVRSIGSAWKVAGPAIEQIFEKIKGAVHEMDESLEHAITRRVQIDKMRDEASSEVNDLRDKLCNHLTTQANKLIQEIDKRFAEQDGKEEKYFQGVSEHLKMFQNVNKYEEHLRRILSSKDFHAVTEADLEALHSLKNSVNLNHTMDPKPKFSSYLFTPNDSLMQLLSEDMGEILTDAEWKHREAAKATSNSNSASTAGFVASPPRQSSLVPVIDDNRDPLPTESMIRIRTRVILPFPIVNPMDAEPYLDDRFIVSDKTGSVTLITANPGSIDGRKIISLKNPVSPDVLVQSGVVITTDKRLFTCNGKETHIEQYDMDRIACVRRIGDESRFASPRCLTYGVANRMLFVSDIKGVVKIFDSYSGQHVNDVGGGLLLTPKGLTTDNNSRLFVADELQGQVYVFDIRMNRVQQPLQKLSTEINGTLLHCHDVAVSANGNIYVTVTRNLTSRVPVSLLVEYDKRGRLMRTGGWELRQPRGLKVVGRSATVVDEKENCIATYML